jgi:uncharacterized protein
MMPPFHLAFAVVDLPSTRRFFCDVLGCEVGRSDQRWIDFDFFGHQITAHLVNEKPKAASNPVDGDMVPSFHFGAVLGWKEWHEFVEHLRNCRQTFLIEPHIRFGGQVGEQATCFINDPSGNALEFKSFKNPDRLFESTPE